MKKSQKYKVAVVQASPVLFNREATTEKTCQLLQRIAWRMANSFVTFKGIYINIFGGETVKPVSERRYLKMKTHQTLPWSNRFGFRHRPQRIYHVFCKTVSI